MEGDESLKTVDCLRGRLLAERAASMSANHNALLLDFKLKDLEKQLENEIKLRKKAERKLDKLKNKLQSFNIPLSIVSQQSTSSDHSAESCISSTDSNTLLNHHHHHHHHVNEAEAEAEDVNEEKKSEEDVNGAEAEEAEEEEVDNSMALVVVDCFQETNKWNTNRNTNTNSDSGRMDDETVRDVLNTLKQIKDNLRCYLDPTRHIIRV